MTLKIFTILTIAFLYQPFGFSNCAFGAKKFHHRTTSYSRCYIPYYKNARYLPFTAGGRDSLVASSTLDQPRVFLQNPARNGAEAEGRQERIYFKTFSSLRNSLTADGVTLDRIGLQITDEGQALCTGRVSYNGGDNGNLLGAHVTISVQVYSASSSSEESLNTARLIWAQKQKFWVRRNEVSAISLIPHKGQVKQRPALKENPGNEMIEKHFSGITHLEVVLETRKAK